MHSRLACLLAVAVLLAAPSFAQEPPRFFIERIEVLSVDRVSPGVIQSESRLREGRPYGEDELREAIDRVRRLPFVLDASFALQKGSERDRYVLAITVTEAKPLFYLFDTLAFKKGSDDLLIDSTNDIVLGGRWFVGSRGAVHVGLFARDPQRPFTKSYGAFQAGYTQYDLFGTGALVTIAVSQISGGVPGRDAVPEAVVAIPLTSKQTITAAYSGSDISGSRERVFEARWSYNTTNHPFFPTRGTVLSAGPVGAWTDARVRDSLAGPTIFVDSAAIGAELEVKRHWEFSETTSLSAELLAGAAQIRQRRDETQSDFSQGYGNALLRLSRTLSGENRDPRSRLELTLRTVASGSDRLHVAREGVTELSVSVARRNAWGAVRLGVGYAW